MTKLNYVRPLNHRECAKLVLTVGTTLTPVIKSEPGTGKTTLAQTIAEMVGDKWRRPGEFYAEDKYDHIYVDCPTKDMGDMVMNIPVHEQRELVSYVAAQLNLRNPRPKIIMLDEFLKTPKLMKILFTRLILERFVGDVPLPEGSMVFATSNNEGEGLGDTLAAHEGNRVMVTEYAKPTNEEWLRWANLNGISALTRAWAALNPKAFNSYRSLSDGELSQNPFIYNPKNPAQSVTFLSPRSLAKNDVIVRNKTVLGEDVALAAMKGTVGIAAAEAMNAFFLIEKDLMPTRQIIANPTGVPIPDNAGALLMMLFNAVEDIVTQDDLSAFMQFVKRLVNKEWQSIFYTSVCQDKRTVKLAKNNKDLSDWMLKHFYLFT